MPLDIDLRKGCRRDAATFFVQKHTTLKPFTKMATVHKNLSDLGGKLPSAAGMKFGIVVSEWNEQITEALLQGAVKTLKEAGCDEQNIIIKHVPGTFELPLGAQFFAEYTDVDGVIALGCDRAGGKYGNKGDEAAAAAIKMVALQQEMEPEDSAADRRKIN